MDPYQFPETIERSIHEHEVFIAFNNDSDAVYFHEWWYKTGKASFEEYVENAET